MLRIRKRKIVSAQIEPKGREKEWIWWYYIIIIQILMIFLQADT